MHLKLSLKGILLMLSLMISYHALAQGKTITGKVRDAGTREPVSFASVAIKGNTQIGAYTDDNGNFTITNVPSNATTLMVSFIGYTSLEIPIGTRTQFDIQLEPDATMLEQTVVTALGITRQSKEIGYATAKISSDELTENKNMDASQALIGKVSGLQISVASASVDAGVRINLRGSRSFLGNNEPMLIVDGVPTPMSYFQSINPNDIENISVLKGASSAALYGSDAANGVIYITTKSGERGRPRVTYSLTTTFDQMAYFPKYQTRFGSGAEDSNGFPYYIAYENQQYGPEFDGSEVPIGNKFMNSAGEIIQLYESYDYKEGAREAYYQTGVGLQNDISFTSGGENGSFFLSYQNASRTGTIKGDQYDRQTVRFNASRVYKNLKVSANVSYSNTMTDMNRSASSGMQALWNTSAHINLPQYEDWRNVEGGNPNEWVNAYYPNPYQQLESSRAKSTSDRFSGTGTAEWKPLEWLRFMGRAGVNMNVSNTNNRAYAWRYNAYAVNSGRSYAYNGDELSSLTTSSSYGNRINIDAMAFAEHDFNEDFAIKGMLGYSLYNYYGESKSVAGSSMIIDDFFNVSNRGSDMTGSNSFTRTRKLGAYGSVDFKLFGWAYLQLTGRNDWTSLLAPGNRSFFYPGANASVMLSDALPSLKNNNFLSYLKLRATYAKVGTVNISPYNLYDIGVKHSSFPFGNLTAYYASVNIRNPNIKPEFTTEFEVGAEVGLFDDRITVEAAYYNQVTTNQTVNTTLPNSTGYSTKYVNAGTMQGQGIEFDLKLTPLLELGELRWNLNTNFTYAKTTVTDIYGGLPELAIYSAVYAILGENYPMIKATDYARSPDGKVIVSPTTGTPVLGGLTTQGTTEPLYRLGLNTSLNWRGFSLATTFDYRGGHVVRFGHEYEMLFTGSSYTSALMGRERFVFPDSVYEVKDENGNISYEDNTDITLNSGGKSYWTSNYRSNRAATVVSGNSWKWRELSVSYELPDRLLDKTGFIQRVSLGVVGRNLMIWTPDTNVWGDPEFWNGGRSNSPGMINNSAASARTFGFNLLISF